MTNWRSDHLCRRPCKRGHRRGLELEVPTPTIRAHWVAVRGRWGGLHKVVLEGCKPLGPQTLDYSEGGRRWRRRGFEGIFPPGTNTTNLHSSCLVTTLLLNQLSTTDPRSDTHHQQACLKYNQPMVGLKKGDINLTVVKLGVKKTPKKTALQPNIESSALAAEVLWRWRRLGPASEISFFYVLPLQRYHCVGILRFMPNPSQNSHILPAVIRRSRLTDYFGQNLHET